MKNAFLQPFLPPRPRAFVAQLPGGGTLQVQYRETIGLCFLLEGSFESAEIEMLCTYARRDSTAVDVGANIGVHTIPLARAVGARGSVIAFEPVQENVERLQRNLEINGLANAHIFPLAVGENSETAVLQLADDPAFHSTAVVARGRALGRSTRVKTSSLDVVWNEVHRPFVSVVKIDVEGTELSVLKGASELLAVCRPVLLLEITSGKSFDKIAGFLAAYDYDSQQPQGFMHWNYLFVAERSDDPD